MGLYFRNTTSSTVTLVLVYHDPDCLSDCNDPYLKKGWYTIPSGGTTKVWSGAVYGERFYFYAHSDVRTWSGQNDPQRRFSEVSPYRFEFCWCVADTNSYTVGFAHLAPASFPTVDRTVSLT
jgi:Protein of unknown function (DUF1036)